MKLQTLKIILAERGIKQKDLAAAVGLTTVYLCNIISPRPPRLSFEKKNAIAKYLKLRIDAIDWRGV
jgi:DNA-binding Xre family transcriptional regulator